MAITVFQHTPTENAGRLGATLRDHGKRLDVRRLDLPVGGPLRNPHVPTDFDDVEAVITLGGAMNVGDGYTWEKPEMEFLAEAHRRNLPLVGICLGAQLIAKALGGEVGPMAAGAGGAGGAAGVGGPDGQIGGEWGMLEVGQFQVANTDTILAGIPWTCRQMCAHGQEVKALPPGATALQHTPACKVQSFRAGLRTYGFQYHFECDLPMVERFFDGDEPLVSCCVGGPREGVAKARRMYPEYARVSERLCVNLATYLFSVSRRIVA